jgi:hypothetical protein
MLIKFSIPVEIEADNILSFSDITHGSLKSIVGSKKC